MCIYIIYLYIYIYLFYIYNIYRHNHKMSCQINVLNPVSQHKENITFHNDRRPARYKGNIALVMLYYMPSITMSERCSCEDNARLQWL